MQGHKSTDCWEKEKMHQNGPCVGHLCIEHHDMVILAISVGDVRAANCPKHNDKINVVENTLDLDQEHMLVADMLKKYNKLKDNTWLCDSGATCHLMNDPTGVYDIIEIYETAIIGDGNGLKITKKGKLYVIVKQNNGSTCDLTLDVKVVPEVAHQLLSHTMQEGWKVMTMQSNNPMMSIIEFECDNKKFKVDQIIKSGELALMGVRLNNKFNYANVASIMKKKITYKDFHNKIGHCGNDLIASTAKPMGIELVGKPFECINRTVRKSKKRS